MLLSSIYICCVRKYLLSKNKHANIFIFSTTTTNNNKKKIHRSLTGNNFAYSKAFRVRVSIRLYFRIFSLIYSLLYNLIYILSPSLPLTVKINHPKQKLNQKRFFFLFFERLKVMLYFLWLRISVAGKGVA